MDENVSREDSDVLDLRVSANQRRQMQARNVSTSAPISATATVSDRPISGIEHLLRAAEYAERLTPTFGNGHVRLAGSAQIVGTLPSSLLGSVESAQSSLTAFSPTTNFESVYAARCIPSVIAQTVAGNQTACISHPSIATITTSTLRASTANSSVSTNTFTDEVDIKALQSEFYPDKSLTFTEVLNMTGDLPYECAAISRPASIAETCVSSSNVNHTISSRSNMHEVIALCSPSTNDDKTSENNSSSMKLRSRGKTTAFEKFNRFKRFFTYTNGNDNQLINVSPKFLSKPDMCGDRYDMRLNPEQYPLKEFMRKMGLYAWEDLVDWEPRRSTRLKCNSGSLAKNTVPVQRTSSRQRISKQQPDKLNPSETQPSPSSKRVLRRGRGLSDDISKRKVSTPSSSICSTDSAELVPAPKIYKPRRQLLKSKPKKILANKAAPKIATHTTCTSNESSESQGPAATQPTWPNQHTLGTSFLDGIEADLTIPPPKLLSSKTSKYAQSVRRCVVCKESFDELYVCPMCSFFFHPKCHNNCFFSMHYICPICCQCREI